MYLRCVKKSKMRSRLRWEGREWVKGVERERMGERV